MSIKEITHGEPMPFWKKDTPGNKNDLTLPNTGRLKSLRLWSDFDSGNGIGVLGLFLLWGLITLKALIFVYQDEFFKYITLWTQ